MKPAPEPQNNFNYKITQFFLNNTRLTIISFILLIVLGTISTLLLKTTGFPSPELKTAFITTIYPGASSETVNKEITIPLEGKIKDIAGIESFISNSQSSFSQISATISDSADSNTIRNKIQTAISSVTLPDNAQKPQIGSFDIGGPDYILSISSNSSEKTYNTFEKLKSSLEEVPETSQVTATSPINKVLEIRIDKLKLDEYGISINDISTKLKLLNEDLPVLNNVIIDGKTVGISTQINDGNIDSIKKLSFTKASPPTQTVAAVANDRNAFVALPQNSNLNNNTVKLEDFATINFAYNIDDTSTAQIGLKDVSLNKTKINTSLVFQIKTKANSDQSAYQKVLEDKIKNIEGISYNPKGEYKLEDDKIQIVEHYTISEQNSNQVNEVIEGLIGGPLKIRNSTLAQVGWLLGGIQLVFIVMVLFVSWRAAIVAAISIPLSLVFSNIYLYFTGESLNTLVLFSLVLVIGLVVDPALVILESIQRKIDIGLKGRDAALAAVKDVGNGLFLATLTNIIVFLPFGLISGLLGQIFKYIPLTIVPATIGSYIVPLVFLAWIGSYVLKKNKNTSHDEEKNLWRTAKWLVKFNENILNGSRWLRFVIIIGALIISFAVSYIFTSTKQIRVVQFSQSQNGPLLTVSGSFNANTTPEQKKQITDDIIGKILNNDSVLDVYPFNLQSGVSMYVNLKNTIDRPNTKSVEIAKSINSDLSDIKSKLFDLSVGVDSNGPSGDAFSVAISVKSPDLDKIKQGSFDIAEVLSNKVCVNTENKKITVREKGCEDKEIKIVQRSDNGYTNKESNQIDLIFDRSILETNKLVAPGAPATFLVNQGIKNQFNLNNPGGIDIDLGGEKLPLDLAYSTKPPTTIDDIKNISVGTLIGDTAKIGDIAKIEQTSSKSTISRVNGQTIGVVKAKLLDNYNDQAFSGQVTTAIEDYYGQSNFEKTKALGLENNAITSYSEGGSASFAKSFQDLITALLLAIVLTYLVLAVFFNSLTQPLVILYTIPLTFVGIFPSLAWLGTGEFGFLEIIGLIILVGLVENVAIFLIDAANQNIHAGMNEKRAIALASGLRFRPVILTKITAIASLAPLAFLSEFYRSISLVIIFGLLASGFVSLITTPILFIFFRWLSRTYLKLAWYHKVLFFPLLPIYVTVMAYKDKPQLTTLAHKHIDSLVK